MPDYAEGASAASSFIGTPALAIRKDTPAATATSLDGSAARMTTDAFQNLRTTQEGGAPTYFASSAFACDSTATDIWVFPGVAATVFKILWIAISSVATSAANGRIQILRRSTANTAGTAVAPTIAKADSRNPTAGGAPTHYTAHPTALGTTAGVVRTFQYVQQAAGTFPVSYYMADFRHEFGAQGLRIAGVLEFLAINAAAALGASGNLWDITAAWKEDSPTA